MYANSNFNRIVKEVIAKDKKAEEERIAQLKKEEFANSSYGKLLSAMKDWRNDYAKEAFKDMEFFKGSVWDNVKIGSTLRIKFPSDFKINKT